MCPEFFHFLNKHSVENNLEYKISPVVSPFWNQIFFILKNDYETMKQPQNNDMNDLHVPQNEMEVERILLRIEIKFSLSFIFTGKCWNYFHTK